MKNIKFETDIYSVVFHVVTNVLEESAASIFMVTVMVLKPKRPQSQSVNDA